MSPRRFLSSPIAASMLASSPVAGEQRVHQAHRHLDADLLGALALLAVLAGLPLLVDEHLDEVALAHDLHVLLLRLDAHELGVAHGGELLPDAAQVGQLEAVIVSRRCGCGRAARSAPARPCSTASTTLSGRLTDTLDESLASSTRTWSQAIPRLGGRPGPRSTAARASSPDACQDALPHVITSARPLLGRSAGFTCCYARGPPGSRKSDPSGWTGSNWADPAPDCHFWRVDPRSGPETCCRVPADEATRIQ